MENIKLNASDGYSLCLHVFEVKDSKGVVQVLHGMEEHQERYEPLVKELNDHGFSVVTSNMRGHGDDAPELGFFAEKDGYKLVIDDQKKITEYIKNRFKVEKVYIYAHSMGTITARNLLKTESKNYEKVILSGYPCPNPISGVAVMLTSIHAKIKGNHYFSKFYEDLAVGFNKSIKNPRTGFDWLSHNEENVNRYIDDPYCGHGFKISALRDLTTLLKNMAKNDYVNVNKELPILLISGEDDPCTGGEKGRLNSIRLLTTGGFKNIEVKTYPEMRHEILQEKGANDVIKDVLNFYSK